MKQFEITDPPLTLDACKPCTLVWFDPSEFEAIPEGVVETVDELDLRGRQALAEYQVKQMAEQARAGDPTPDENWKWLPAFLGLPAQSQTGIKFGEMSPYSVYERITPSPHYSIAPFPVSVANLPIPAKVNSR